MPVFTAVSEIIQAALEKIEVQDPGEPMSNTDANTGLRELNLLLDEYSLDRGKIFIRTEDVETLVVGTGSYAIGPLQTFDTAVPVLIEQAFLRDTSVTPNYDRPLRVNMTQAEYNALTFKNMSNLPHALYFSGGTSPATIYFDYAPDRAYELHLFSCKALTKLTDITAALVLPDGYEALITAALGIRLAPLFHKPVPDVLARTEAKMAQLIDSRNSEPPPNWVDRSVPKTMDWGRGGGRNADRSRGDGRING